MTGKVLEKLWGFDLNLMKIKAAACSPLPAPIGAAVKTAAVSLLLWFSKPRLVIYPFPSIQHQCCPPRAPWWSVCCFGGRHLPKSLDLAGASRSPMGMRILNHCPSPYLLPRLMSFNYGDHKCFVFLGRLRQCLAPGIPWGCPGMKVSDGDQ